MNEGLEYLRGRRGVCDVREVNPTTYSGHDIEIVIDLNRCRTWHVEHVIKVVNGMLGDAPYTMRKQFVEDKLLLRFTVPNTYWDVFSLILR